MSILYFRSSLETSVNDELDGLWEANASKLKKWVMYAADMYYKGVSTNTCHAYVL